MANVFERFRAILTYKVKYKQVKKMNSGTMSITSLTGFIEQHFFTAWMLRDGVIQ
jgi:hypothetical protein